MGAEQIQKLAESGILGVLLAISLVAIVYLYKEVRSLQEKRIEDLKESRDAIIKPLNSLQETVTRILTLVEKIKDAE